MSPGLSIERVSKAWPESGAVGLRSLSLDVQPGEMVSVLGPSGSGKSTALRIVAGLETPDEGVVRIGGADVTALEPSRRRVAMVFQSFALFPHLSVEQNIAFGLRARGGDRAAAAKRARDVAESLGLEGLLERRPAQLSGGERQRVALARGLAGRPDVLLLDEPLSNLDAQLRADARAEVRRVQAAAQLTTLYVTHDQDEALALGDRVAVLRDGALQQVGTPDEIYDRPANRFVASFVGSPPMNLIAAEDAARVIGFSPPRGTVAGFRPEHVQPGAGVAARVELVERAGHESLWRLDVDGLAIVARVPAAAGTPDGEVRVRVDLARVRLFHADSGEAVAG